MCYTVPLAGAVITTGVWSRTKTAKTWWLALMFYGGAMFGVIDHLWNDGLLLIWQNIVNDMLLGVVISASILTAWAVLAGVVKPDQAA